MWWRNLSVTNKLYTIVGVMALVVVGGVAPMTWAVGAMSAMRAFVNAEGLWSKAQKDAINDLQMYALTHKQIYYEDYLNNMGVLFAAKNSRLELGQPKPNTKLVFAGLNKMGIHEDDIPGIINLYNRLSWFEFVREPIAIWKTTDSYVQDIFKIGVRIHDQISKGQSVSYLEPLLVEIDTIDETLTQFERAFSDKIGEGSRVMDKWLWLIVTAIASLIGIGGISLTIYINRDIVRRLNEIVAATVRAGQWDFSQKLLVNSLDEIGMLAQAVNEMSADLDQNINQRLKAEEQLKKSYDELEKRVVLRTNELAQVNLQLEAEVVEHQLTEVQLRQSKDKLDIILSGITEGVMMYDLNGRFLFVNQAAAKMAGFSTPEELMSITLEELHERAKMFTVEGKEIEPASLPSRQLFKTKVPSQIVIKVRINGSGEEVWRISKAVPILDDHGEIRYGISIWTDITEIKKAEKNIHFLADASKRLAESLDLQTILTKCSHLVVPDLGDIGIIEVEAPGGTILRKVFGQVDARYQPTLDSLKESKQPLFLKQITRDKAETIFVPDLNHAEAGGPLKGSELAVLAKLGARAVILVPLRARGQNRGSLTIIKQTSARNYDAPTLSLIEELATRFSFAIDSALLYEQAQKAIQSRDEFLSLASHELKTPITSLMIQLQMANRGVKPENNSAPTPEKLAKVFNISIRQVDRLTSLIEDLLDVSKIQAGKLSFDFRPVDLESLFKEIIERLSGEFAMSKCSIHLQVKNKVVGNWDLARIEQVILNLLTNAVKYAPGSTINVTLESDDRNARFVVRDNGPGVPLELQSKIFERFERAESSKGVTGLGLGLYISKQIVVSHGGRISIESEPGKGSAFIVELPLRPVQVATGESPQPPAASF